MESEVIEFLPGHDALCVTMNIFPEHVIAEYDAIRASAEAAISAIGAPARKQEAQEEFDRLKMQPPVVDSVVTQKLFYIDPDPSIVLKELFANVPTTRQRTDPKATGGN